MLIVLELALLPSIDLGEVILCCVDGCMDWWSITMLLIAVCPLAAWLWSHCCTSASFTLSYELSQGLSLIVSLLAVFQGLSLLGLDAFRLSLPVCLLVARILWIAFFRGDVPSRLAYKPVVLDCGCTPADCDVLIVLLSQ